VGLVKKSFVASVAGAFLIAGFVTPASAQDQIISTFDGVYAAEDKLAGYTTSVSVLPGEALKLRVRSVEIGRAHV
jgi:hypothetical protein